MDKIELGNDLIAEAITEAFGERCPEFSAGCWACEAWAQYDTLSAAKSEPVAVKAWCQPMKEGKHTPRQFVVLYEDAEQGICTFDDEAEARDHWERANVNWNCYLLGTLPLASEPANG